MTAWGGPKRLVYGVLGGMFGMGLLGPLALGLAQSVPMWFMGTLFMVIFGSVFMASLGALFQRKVPPGLQGRVFAMRRLITYVGQPVILFSVGPLADQVLNPLMAGPLGDQLAPFLGDHAARGASLMLVLIGLALMIVSALTLLNPRVRKLEDEIPDATVQT